MTVPEELPDVGVTVSEMERSRSNWVTNSAPTVSRTVMKSASGTLTPLRPPTK